MLSRSGEVPKEIFFINKGILRVIATDPGGIQHTVHFAMENQFIANYASFILKQPSIYDLQAIEDSEVVVMPGKQLSGGMRT